MCAVGAGLLHWVVSFTDAYIYVKYRPHTFITTLLTDALDILYQSDMRVQGVVDNGLQKEKVRLRQLDRSLTEARGKLNNRRAELRQRDLELRKEKNSIECQLRSAEYLSL